MIKKATVITFSGEPGSGKSTLCKTILDILEAGGHSVKLVSASKIFRAMFGESNDDLVYALKHEKIADINKLIEIAVRDSVELLTYSGVDYILVDSRMAFLSLPLSLKVYTVSPVPLTKERLERKAAESESFLKTYGVDLHVRKGFDYLFSYDVSRSIKDNAADLLFELGCLH